VLLFLSYQPSAVTTSTIDLLSKADDTNWRKSIDDALAVLRG